MMTVFLVGLIPTISTSSPTLQAPLSIRPVPTVPRPVMEKPFRPSAKQSLTSYYEVPLEIVEDGAQLIAWAREAARV